MKVTIEGTLKQVSKALRSRGLGAGRRPVGRIGGYSKVAIRNAKIAEEYGILVKAFKLVRGNPAECQAADLFLDAIGDLSKRTEDVINSALRIVERREALVSHPNQREGRGMTRDEAVAATLEAKKQWGGGSSEYWLVIALEALGVLKLDDPPKTLWELLRKHGVALDNAQAICNDAMLNGVTVPADGADCMVTSKNQPKD